MAKKNMTLEEKMEEAIVKDFPYEVPGNWVWVGLKELCQLINGDRGKNYPSKDELVEKGIAFINAGALKEGTIDIENLNYITENKFLILNSGKVQKNDILYCLRGTIGKNAYILDEMEGAVASSLCIIRTNKQINSKYIFYLLNSETIIRQQNIVNNGTAQPNLSGQSVKEYKIPLSPLKEQQRIVDRIESLFEKLDKAKELIEEARDGFEKRKAAILKNAFNGELTEKWRKRNDISSNTLLNDILTLNKNIKKSFEITIANNIYEIPSNWTWIKLKDICEKFKYGTSTKSQSEGSVPVLRMGNLQQGKLIWDNLVYTSDEEEISKYDLQKGDLLFNRTNSPELVGKTSIYNGEMNAIFAGYLIRIRVLEGINASYINYFMNSIHAKARCMEVKSDGVSQSNINAEKLGEFDIPLPSTEEQEEIVRILDKILEEEAKIEELTQLEGQIELIKKSILAKAFRGELGTTEEDESALELLKEILSKE